MWPLCAQEAFAFSSGELPVGGEVEVKLDQRDMACVCLSLRVLHQARPDTTGSKAPPRWFSEAHVHDTAVYIGEVSLARELPGSRNASRARHSRAGADSGDSFMAIECNPSETKLYVALLKKVLLCRCCAGA